MFSPLFANAQSDPRLYRQECPSVQILDLIIPKIVTGWGGLEALKKLRSYETLNRWSGGLKTHFGERGPGSIPGAGTFKDIVL